MKCLSVCQPFAELIVQGKKTIELRKWNTKFRGEFLVHAPQKIRTDDCRRLKIKDNLTTGAIIGKVELVNVKKYENESELKLDSKKHLALNNKSDKMENIMRKIIKVSDEELNLHKKFLKSNLQRNYFK